MIQAVPLMLDGVLCRAHYVIGIHEMNGKIVFLHDVLGDVPKEQITRDTVFTDYVVADFFSADFEAHTQDHLVYPEKKTLFDSCCMCEPKADCLLLNTMYYDPSNGGANEYSRHRTIAKLIEIQDDSLREVGDSPEPIQKSYSDSKMFFFGDCSVYMVSPHVMECTQGGEVVWRLRLNAWLFTDVEEKSGILYFGTAGGGGRFYGVSLQNGNAFFAYDTGGTVRYAWHKNNALVIDRKGDIVLLDSQTGAETKRIEFRKRKLRATPYMLVRGDRLYAAAMDYKEFYDFYAVCIDL